MSEEQVNTETGELTPKPTTEETLEKRLSEAETARDYRKVAESAAHAALRAMHGRGGMSAQAKIERMQSARDRMLLAVKAMNKGIDAAAAQAKAAEQAPEPTDEEPGF